MWCVTKVLVNCVWLLAGEEVPELRVCQTLFNL